MTDRDTNFALMAERRHYPWPLDGQPVLFVGLSKGIGGAVYSGNKIMRGNLGIAGEIGHMSINTGGIPCECGNTGCLERYASTSVIVDNVHARVGAFSTALNRDSTITDIIAAYRGGDTLAHLCVNEVAVHVGYALASLSNVLNPGLIIIGDVLSSAGDPFLAEIKRAFNERVSAAVRESTIISLSTVKEDPFLLGGIEAVVENCLALSDFWIRHTDTISPH